LYIITTKIIAPRITPHQILSIFIFHFRFRKRGRHLAPIPGIREQLVLNRDSSKVATRAKKERRLRPARPAPAKGLHETAPGRRPFRGAAQVLLS
jgi:hypothetical protein